MYTILGPFPSDIYCNGKFSKDLSAFTDKRPDNDNGETNNTVFSYVITENYMMDFNIDYIHI